MQHMWHSSALPRWARRAVVLGVFFLLVAACSYGGLWVYAASRVKAGFVEWTQTAQAEKLNIAWEDIHLGGFPTRFDLELQGVRIVDTAVTGPVEASAPNIIVSSKGWSFRDWVLAAPKGLRATLDTGNGLPGTITAKNGTGAVSVGPDGAATIWVTLWDIEADLTLDRAGQVRAGKAASWLILPAHKPRTPDEQYLGVGAVLQRIGLSAAPSPFSTTINDVAFGLRVMGAIPDAPVLKGIESWSQAGGRVQIEHFELFWDELAIRASGNIELDPDLQPRGSISAAIEGYDQLLTALSVAGRLAPGAVSPTKFALAMLGPSISTNVTIKNGDMFLGAINIGKVPTIGWK